MADIFEVCDIITEMSDGFVPTVLGCLSEHADKAASAVREQMYSGIDGDGKFLSPTYDDDPYFEEKGPWQGRAQEYKKWKMDITPPVPGTMLNIPARPESVPNLFIDGTFHSEVFSEMRGDSLVVDVKEDGDAPDIVAKYGSQLLQLSPSAIEYFNDRFILPSIKEFFAKCGW